MVSEVAL